MPVMQIYPDMEGKNEDLRKKTPIQVDPDDVRWGALPHGMVSGKTSVGILAPLPDGKSYAFIETSLRAFIGFVVALHAKYEDEFRENGVILEVTLQPPGRE